MDIDNADLKYIINRICTCKDSSYGLCDVFDVDPDEGYKLKCVRLTVKLFYTPQVLLEF